MQELHRQQRNQTIDLLKLVLSLFVVLIHAEVRVGLFKPFLRMAVPLFFIISSYFFFCKISENSADNNKRLIRFLSRNLTLYAFWFVALLPITLYIRNWFSDSMLNGIFLFFQSLLFNSTFRASWYLMALNIGICIAFFCSRKISTGMFMLLTAPVYLLCCLFSNYYGLVSENAMVMGIYNGYIHWFRSLCNSFPASLFWIALGRFFAQHRISIPQNRLLAGILLFSGLLIAEYIMVTASALQQSDEAYIMLVPLCSCVFLYVKNWNIQWKRYYRLGEISTIIYVTHASVITVVGAIVRRLVPAIGSNVNIVVLFLTLCICGFISAVIFYLAEKRNISWIRIAY